jgi:integrase
MSGKLGEIKDQWLVPRERGEIDPFDRYVVARLSAGSRRTARQALSMMAGVVLGVDRREVEKLRGLDLHAFRWERLTAAEIGRIRKAVIRAYRPATANKMLSFLRGVLRAVEAGCSASDSVSAGLAGSIDWVPLGAAEDNRVLDADEVSRLFIACSAEAGPGGRRDAALAATCLSSGIRRVEATELRLEDYNERCKELAICSEGSSEARVIKFSDEAGRYMKEWLKERGDEPGPLFLPITRGGRIDMRQMTDQAIYSILARLSERANVQHMTTRDLRRTYVVGLIASGKSIEATQAAVGHAHWLTTAMYRDLGQSASESWPRGVEIPYVEHEQTLKGGSK